MKHDVTPPRDRAATPVAAALGALLLLAACASPPPTHFYTLMPAAAPGASADAVNRLDWDLGPVRVAQQVDQPQWVVRAADGTLVILENERWIAPLADEIRGAVGERLTRSFGPPRTQPAAPAQPAWRVGIDVQRFEMLPGREARLDANWSLRGESVALTCRTALSLPVPQADYAALARAQQQAVQQLADTIATALGAASKGAAAAC